MNRALIGGWMVVVVLSGLLASATLFGPPETGNAVRQAPPTPPAVGTCVTGLRDLTVVPCGSEHSGQITMAWTGGSSTVELDPVQFPPDRYPRDNPAAWCDLAAEDYLGGDPMGPELPVGEWVTPTPTPPGWTSRVARGPERPAVAGWTWSACILEASGVDGDPLTLDRSLRDLSQTPMAEIPDAWLTCSLDASAWSGQVACSAPHRQQTFAFGQFSLSAAELADLTGKRDEWSQTRDPASLEGPDFLITDEALAQSCRAVVDTALNGTLDTYADDLRAVVSFMMFVYDENGSLVSTDAAAPVGALANCSVRVIGDRALVGSLYGIGSGPLPFDQ